MLNKAREVLFRDMGLKAISLVFALVIYSLVHGAQDAQRSFSVDLVALTPPLSANRILTTSLPPRIRVTVHGSRNLLDDLHSDDLGTIQLDIRQGVQGRLPLTSDMVHVPTGVQVQQIDPPWIELNWEDRIMRDVSVQVSVVGSPAPGFVVKGTPDSVVRTVRVSGPKSQVSTLQHVRAEAFDVNGLTQGKYNRQLALDKPSGRVDLEAQSIEVTLEVAREIAERHFARVHLNVTGNPHAHATPNEVEVRLTCPPEVVSGLKLEQILAQVDVASKDPSGSQSLPISVKVPQCEAKITPDHAIVRW